MLECPRCRSALRIVIESSVEVDVCDDCGGVWLDAGELGRVAASPLESLETSELVDVQDLKCPRCGTNRFVDIRTNLGHFEKCGDCDGMSVDSQTLDAIAKSDRQELPGKKATGAVVGSLQGFQGLFDFLWLFAQH